MTNWSGGPNPGDASGWVDPDAPTGIAPQQQRPGPGGWQPPPGPPAGAPVAPPPGQPQQPWPAQNHPPSTGPWPHQPPPAPPQPSWPVGTPGVAPVSGPYFGHVPPGGPPTKRRTPLIVGLIAAGVVVIVVAVLGIKAVGGSAGGEGISASDTVKAYLEALSSGDAATALSYGSAQPASTDLLTDDILDKQLARMPISNIRILDEDTSTMSIGMTTVHAAVNFGNVVDDVELRLKKDGEDTWKLETAAIKIDPPPGADSNLGAKSVTIFGKDFDEGSLYVFPGYLEVGSSNSYVKATAEPLLLQYLSTYSTAWLSPEISLNDEGRAAINDSLVAAFAKCQQSNLLAPPGCPTRVRFSDAVEGTVGWGPADLAGVTIGDLSPYRLTVFLGGEAKIPLSYRSTTGETVRGVANAYIGGDADMTTEPPRLNL